MDHFTDFSIMPPPAVVLIRHICPACGRLIEESEPKFARIVCPRCKQRIVFKGGVAVEHRPRRRQ